MISAIFIERPRLAFVISIVITLAGLIAILVIPVAQFPEIVPPSVRVSGIYPGANAETVEATPTVVEAVAEAPSGDEAAEAAEAAPAAAEAAPEAAEEAPAAEETAPEVEETTEAAPDDTQA